MTDDTMKKYQVKFWVLVERSAIVEAGGKQAAIEMVEDGKVGGYDTGVSEMADDEVTAEVWP